MLSQGLAGGIPRSLVFSDSDSEYDETDDEELAYNISEVGASATRPAIVFSGYAEPRNPMDMSGSLKAEASPQAAPRDAFHGALDTAVGSSLVKSR